MLSTKGDAQYTCLEVLVKSEGKLRVEGFKPWYPIMINKYLQ